MSIAARRRLGAFKVGIAIWGMMVGLKAVDEAHQFSAWRALGAALLAGAVVIIPIVAIIALILAGAAV